MQAAPTENFHINQDINDSLFASFSYFLSLNCLENVAKNKYLSWSIPKIEEATTKLNQFLPIIPTLPPDKAEEIYNAIYMFKPYLDNNKSEIESIQDSELLKLKEVFFEHMKVLQELMTRLEKAKKQADSARAVFHYTAKNTPHPMFDKY